MGGSKGGNKGHPSAAQRRDAEGLTIGDSDAEDEPEELDPPDAHDHDGIPDPATFTNTQNRNPRIPNVKIPFFKGGANLDPGENREWRREIAAIKHSYKIEHTRTSQVWSSSPPTAMPGMCSGTSTPRTSRTTRTA